MAETTTTETLRVKNFAGIREAELDLSRVNIFIGPQASGKSVCAKLFYYFKELIPRLAIEIDVGNTNDQIRTGHKELFLKYFPPVSWSEEPFEISYSLKDFQVKVERKKNGSSSIDITYSDYYNALLRTARAAYRRGQKQEDENDDLSPTPFEYAQSIVEDKVSQDLGGALVNRNYFVPAGRSFFSTLQSSVFGLIAEDVRIDPFLVAFGRLYQSVLRRQISWAFREQEDVGRINDHISRLICGTYKRSKARGYIETSDGRQVPVELSSSGQQEALPLALLLASIARTSRSISRSTVFVEEPEAHLYPSAQREIVHLLAAVTDLSSQSASSQYVITTHSPYILSALNNLMYGEKIAREAPDKRERITKILGNASLVDAANVRAYSFDGRVQSIIDPDSGLVNAAVLDSVSNELAKEFGALVDIMLGEDEE